jgi:hypothetical protein
MAEVDKLEDALQAELPFEQEYNIQKAAAPLYKNSDVFRLNIVKSCREVFYGQRSTTNFVKLASALILDKDDDFKQHQLPIKTYYFNSIKSYENLWDEIFELKKANEDRQNAPDPENIRKYKLYTTRLVNIIKGLVVIHLYTHTRLATLGFFLHDCNRRVGLEPLQLHVILNTTIAHKS